MSDLVITLPIAPERLKVWLFIFGVILLASVVYGTLAQMDPTNRRRVWDDIPNGWRAVVIGLAPFWIALFVLTVIAAFGGVWKMIPPNETQSGFWQFLFPRESQSGSSLGIGALLAALLGAPFVIWGTVIKQKTLALSETSLFNDKVNAAVEALYSRRQVTRAVTVGDEEKILIEWQDDIVQRSAAIDRLEGLMNERPSEAPRIAKMLSVYVRELSREFPAAEHPRRQFLSLIEPEDETPPLSEFEALAELSLLREEVSVISQTVWASKLQPFRTDVERAVQTLGRMRAIPEVNTSETRIDLREANLQGFDLTMLDFSNAVMTRARMEGANLSEACMDQVDLRAASMEGANVSQAKMEWANLNRASMAGANLREARMNGADISEVKLWHAIFNLTEMRGADLKFARMEDTVIMGARMGGADLFGADMDGAVLYEVQVDSETDVSAELRGAATTNTDFSSVSLSLDQIDQMFGDGSVILPEGVTRPAHWPDWKLDPSDFITEWRKWWADPENYTPPKPKDLP